MDFSQVGEKGKDKTTYLVRPVGEPPMIEPIQKELAKYKPKLATLEKQAKDLKVIDQETFQAAIDGAGTAKGFIKAIKGRIAEITNPFREFNTKVGNLAGVFTKPLQTVAQEFSRKSGDYQYQQELALKKQEKLIAEEAVKLQKKLDAQSEKLGVEAPIVAEVKPKKAETVIPTAGGHSQHLRKQWVGEIEDPKKIPHEYCVPDQKLINQAVKMGTREIPGVKIYEKVSAVHR